MAILDSYAHLLSTHAWMLYLLVGIYSLCIGSFLNVVIYRLPLMLDKQWRAECYQFLDPDTVQVDDNKLTLSEPSSHCPNCNTAIRWYHNLPLFGWILTKGKCAGCSSGISIIYPVVELLTFVCSMLVVYKYGFSLQMVFGLFLTYALLALTFIDFSHQILPDRIVYPLMALGLAISTYGVFITSSTAIWGVIIGFLTFWTVCVLFKILTGKTGMGYGDFKLLAVLGAWFGVTAIPSIIFLSSLMGVVVGFYFLSVKKQSKPFAFGPYLAIAGWIYLLLGSVI